MERELPETEKGIEMYHFLSGYILAIVDAETEAYERHMDRFAEFICDIEHQTRLEYQRKQAEQ